MAALDKFTTIDEKIAGLTELAEAQGRELDALANAFNDFGDTLQLVTQKAHALNPRAPLTVSDVNFLKYPFVVYFEKQDIYLLIRWSTVVTLGPVWIPAATIVIPPWTGPFNLLGQYNVPWRVDVVGLTACDGFTALSLNFDNEDDFGNVLTNPIRFGQGLFSFPLLKCGRPIHLGVSTRWRFCARNDDPINAHSGIAYIYWWRANEISKEQADDYKRL